MITMIWGLPRVGKTALMTKLALDHFRGRQAYEDMKDAKRLIAKLNAGGYDYTMPTDHVVFSDYEIIGPMGRKSHDIDGYRLGLPDPKFKTDFLPPAAQIYLDEAQKYFNSRQKGLSPRVSRIFELHGHFFYNITIVSQRPKLIDLNIRELASEVIEVVELKHKYDYGRIVRSTWVCNRYENAERAITYIEGGKVGKYGERVTYTYEGNIFKRYNSRGNYAAFLDGRSTRNFDIKEATAAGYTPAEVAAYNYTHNYKSPMGYFEKGA